MLNDSGDTDVQTDEGASLNLDEQHPMFEPFSDEELPNSNEAYPPSTATSCINSCVGGC